MVYQGLIMRVGITGGNVYIDFLISGLVEFPAAFLILFTIERIGRRLPFATANIVAGASCIITAFIPDSKRMEQGRFRKPYVRALWLRVSVTLG